MIDQFINFVIRPPRADSDPNPYLLEKNFILAGRKYRREDLELRNERGHKLRCSHYVPSGIQDDTPLPCVVYCHGNSGCRADANEAAEVLLPSNITVFTLDFSGSGLSEGDYVSLGWHEKDDLKVVVSYLKSQEKVSRIGLWGRSMGAVTSLLYGAEDPFVAGMVLDSAFSNLFNLMMEYAALCNIRLPKFTVKMALLYMRRVILRKAKFDITRLDCTQVAPKTFIPALFGYARDDKLVLPRHTDAIFKAYAGDKNIIKFEGDHNSNRPKFYYDSVAVFFYNVLSPPRLSSSYAVNIEKYTSWGRRMVGSGTEKNIFDEMVAGLGNSSANSASSSSTPYDISNVKALGEFLSDFLPYSNDSLASEDTRIHGNGSSLRLEDNRSVTSSNIESWGRCLSVGSDVPRSLPFTSARNHSQMLATHVQDSQKNKIRSPKNVDQKKKKTKKKNEASTSLRKSKREKLEKVESPSLGQRLRSYLPRKVKHSRHCSS